MSHVLQVAVHVSGGHDHVGDTKFSVQLPEQCGDQCSTSPRGMQVGATWVREGSRSAVYSARTRANAGVPNLPSPAAQQPSTVNRYTK